MDLNQIPIYRFYQNMWKIALVQAGQSKYLKKQSKSILDSVTKDQAGRKKSAEYLAYEAGISHTSALRILKRCGLGSVKLSWKPGLTDAAKKQRY